MINISQVPAGVIFLALFFPILLTEIDSRFSAIAWVILLAWYVLMRASLSESTGYLNKWPYRVAALNSFVYVPVLAVTNIAIGNERMNDLFQRYELYVAPFHVAALLFVVYSAWTAARQLVIAETKTAADRAVQWERTWKPFFQLLVWPVGVWFVHKRFQATAK